MSNTAGFADDLIKCWLKTRLGLFISDEKLDLLLKFKNIVLEKNKELNLTAITDDFEFCVKHIIDSLTLLPHIPPSSEVVDVGTGAGFPGVVLKIMRDDIKLCLIDSTKKKIDFLHDALKRLNMADIDLIHTRSEQWAKSNAKRYDICTARAVAELPKLVGYTLPLLKKGGCLLAMKGPGVQSEIQKAKPAIQKHGGVIEDVFTYMLPEGLTRNIVVIRAGVLRS